MEDSKQKLKIKIVIVCISFCQGLQYSISPVLNQIQTHYMDVDVSMIQMLITAPALLAMVVALLAGRLVVFISKKKLLVFASFMAGMTGFLPYLADSFSLLLFSRTLFGVALGLATALNTAVVAEHFKGEERVGAMGVQGASVGMGMLLATTLGGKLGAHHFEYSYLVHSIGLISCILILWLLPDTGKTIVTKTEKIKLNKKVYQISFLGLLEFLFLITFTTNIAMHLSGNLAGNSSVVGILIGVFSGIQIVIGLILGKITKVTKQYTLSISMLSFSLGAVLLILFPSNYFFLLVGALFCGLSQGMFIPQAMCNISEAVSEASTAFAAACFTVFICIGQLSSPTVLNGVSKLLFGSVTTTNVYGIAAVAMCVASILLTIKITKRKYTKHLI